MSKKDFDEYYDKVCADYHEMIETLHDIEEEANKGLVSPDRIDQVKVMLEPLKNNYMTLSWVKFLLNKPVRKAKSNGYSRQNQKFLSALDNNKSPEGIYAENKTVINKLKGANQ